MRRIKITVSQKLNSNSPATTLPNTLSGDLASNLPQKHKQTFLKLWKYLFPKDPPTLHFSFFFFFLIPLFVSSSASHYRLSYSPVSEHVVAQPPAWSATSLPVHAARLLCREGVPPTCLGCCQLLVMRRHHSNVIIYIYKPKSPALERGSTLSNKLFIYYKLFILYKSFFFQFCYHFYSIIYFY